MPIIFETQNASNKVLICDCGNKIDDEYYWVIDRNATCNNCYNDEYSHMVKCCSDNCNEHDDEQNFTNGMCEKCEELSTPLSHEDQEGWEHNILKWNEG